METVKAEPRGCSDRHQRGAAALEFALVFPLLFVLFYSIVVYAYLFVLQESLSYAAQESAAAAIAVSPLQAGPDYDALVTQRVRSRASEVLGWLPERQRGRVLGTGGERVSVNFRPDPATGASLVDVGLVFDADGLFPRFALPLIGKLPPMPEELVASGSALIGEV